MNNHAFQPTAHETENVPQNGNAPMNGKEFDHFNLLPATDPSHKRPIRRLRRFLHDEATFFRIHLAAFTFIPLITAAIFHASNGLYPVSFLDSLFLCYSAMTVTGLSTVNLSTLTKWQQVILYFLMAIVGLIRHMRMVAELTMNPGRHNDSLVDHGFDQEVSTAPLQVSL